VIKLKVCDQAYADLKPSFSTYPCRSDSLKLYNILLASSSEAWLPGGASTAAD
jgi:hypothetical protein